MSARQAALSDRTNAGQLTKPARLLAKMSMKSPRSASKSTTDTAERSSSPLPSPAPAPKLERDVWLVGQELATHDEVFSGPVAWEFPTLVSKIDRELAKDPDLRAYVFGGTEPQQFHQTSDGSIVDSAAAVALNSAQATLASETGKEYTSVTKTTILPIPVMTVVLISGCAAPSTLGITSVQSSTERIVPMKQLKMSWCPWQGAERLMDGGRSSAASGASDRIFVLHCTQRNRRTGSSSIGEMRRKEFEYALPYIARPKDVPEEPEEVRHVQTTYHSESTKKTVHLTFDKDIDRLAIFIPELIEDEGLDEDEYDAIKECLKQAFRTRKAQVAAELEQRQAAMANIPEEEREALNNVKTIKVYPQNANLAAAGEYASTSFINRYYGKADEVI